MQPRPASPNSAASALQRLAALAELNSIELDALRSAASAELRRYLPHCEIIGAGRTAPAPAIVLTGWAGRVRLFPDGRRQILGLLLPGDLIGICYHREAVAATGIMALTQVTLCEAPQPLPDRIGRGLEKAYAVSRALEEFYLYRHIARLGRLSASERLLDWLLETRERLTLSGMSDGKSFPMPLTQEALADLLGLTSVHVNRTLQSLRGERQIEIRGGTARLCDPELAAQRVDYQPAPAIPV